MNNVIIFLELCRYISNENFVVTVYFVQEVRVKKMADRGNSFKDWTTLLPLLVSIFTSLWEKQLAYNSLFYSAAIVIIHIEQVFAEF